MSCAVLVSYIFVPSHATVALFNVLVLWLCRFLFYESLSKHYVLQMDRDEKDKSPRLLTCFKILLNSLWLLLAPPLSLPPAILSAPPSLCHSSFIPSFLISLFFLRDLIYVSRPLSSSYLPYPLSSLLFSPRPSPLSFTSPPCANSSSHKSPPQPAWSHEGGGGA